MSGTILTPQMALVPAWVNAAEATTFADETAQGVAVGVQHLKGQGPVFIIGCRMADGTALFGATSLAHAVSLHGLLGQLILDVQAGAYNAPDTVQ